MDLAASQVKVVAGGPMTGIAQHSLEVPVTKGVAGILALSPEETKDERGMALHKMRQMYRGLSHQFDAS